MHLESLELENFRSFEKATIDFREDLTVLAGENNSGKTNVLEALRIFLSPTDGKRTRYAEEADCRRGSTGGFRLMAKFAGLDDVQRGIFLTALGSPDSTSITYGFRYKPPEGRSRRGTSTWWAGPQEGAEPEPEARALIRHVHLPALRDAVREMASGHPERIGFLLKTLAEEGEVDGLLKLAKNSHAEMQKHALIEKTQKQVSKGLRRLTDGLQAHDAGLRFAEPELRRMARDLRFHLARSGFAFEDLAESGLGYANLLFFAAVLVELQSAKDADLTLFLVEEPEAHLHPQLQALTLEFLRAEAATSKKQVRPRDEPEGRIQIIATSHSPNLTAAVPSDLICILRSSDPPPAAVAVAGPAAEGAKEPGAPAATAAPQAPQPRPASSAVPVWKLQLAGDVLRKIDRYVDVTRASLFFARSILLVEGLAEALLIPVIARKKVFKADSPELARFNAATIIAIESVDFEPYVKLLMTSYGSTRLATRIAIITDEDPGTTGENRAPNLRNLLKDLGGEPISAVHTAQITLEAELFSAGNHELLKRLFLELRPRSEEKWKEQIDKADVKDRPRAFVQIMESSRIRKGDLAQRLAASIEAGTGFTVPAYLTAALQDLVK